MKPRQVIRDDPLVARFMSMCPKDVVVYKPPFKSAIDAKTGVTTYTSENPVIAKVRFASVKGRAIRAWLVGPKREDRAKFNIDRDAAIAASYRGVGEVAEVLMEAALDAAKEIRGNYEVWEHFE